MNERFENDLACYLHYDDAPRRPARARRRKRARKHCARRFFARCCGVLCLCAGVVLLARVWPRWFPPHLTAAREPGGASASVSLGGEWDAQTRLAIETLAAAHPEVQPMLDEPSRWPADVAALLARNEEALGFVLAYPSLIDAAPPARVEEAVRGQLPHAAAMGRALGLHALRRQYPRHHGLRADSALGGGLRPDGGRFSHTRSHRRMGAAPGVCRRGRHQLGADAQRMRALWPVRAGAFTHGSRRVRRAGSRAAYHLQHAPRRFYHGGTFYRADRHAGRAAVRRRPQQSRPQRIPVGVQPFGAADQKSVGLYRMKQGRHKIYRMSFLNNDVKTANL